VEISYKSNSPYGAAAGSEYLVKAECLKLPLKAGGTLNLRWNMFPCQYYFDFVVAGSSWQPGGRSGMFSFLPFLNAWGEYYRTEDFGTAIYSQTGTSGTTTYFAPYNPLEYQAKYSSQTTYFVEQNLKSGLITTYGGSGHPAYGCPLARVDRNGNQVLYNYRNNSSGKPLLRKITGDVAGIIPYFQYANEAIPAPITKMYLYDTNTPSASRTLYFQYQSTSDPSESFLQQIIYPDGCTAGYGLVGPDDTMIQKEVDAEGYTTYFNYAGSLNKTVEPEGRVTYFTYLGASDHPFKTWMTPAGRPPTYFHYSIVNNGADTAQLNCKLDALHEATYYAYNSDVRITKRMDARKNVTYYQYNSLNSLTQEQTAADGATTQYVYGSNGLDVRKTIEPRNVPGSFSVVTYYQYDANRNQTCITDALGNSTQTGYDSSGHGRKVQDPRGDTAYYNYDATSGFLMSTVDAQNNAAYFAYDSSYNQIKSVSPRWTETGSYAGFTAYFGYDQLNRRTKSVDALTNATYYDYTSRGDLLASVDPRNVTTYYEYNGLRLMTLQSVSDASGNPVTASQSRYDPYKNRTASVDGMGNPTYYFYDVVDRFRAQRDALLNHTYFRYDAVGNRTMSCDARLNASYFEYDGLNRVKRQFDPLGNRTYFKYDLAGNSTAIQDALNNATYYAYDQLNRRRCVADALGGRTYFRYDPAGNRTAATDPLNQASYFKYDALNRQVAVADPLGNTAYFGYDAAGNRRKVTTPLQETSYFAYDALNRLTGTTDPLNESASFGYDSVGNRVKVCDALSNTTYYRYDALNRQTAARDALGDSEYFAYDAASNLLKHRDALANSTYYRYDVLNRRTKVSYPDTTYAYFRYDAVSNLTGAKDAWGWTYFSYDALNRITQEMRLLGNSVSHSYDALGNRLKLSIGDGEPAQYFRYDALGRMTAAASTAVGSGGYGNQAWGITFYGGAGSIPGSGTAYYAYDAASRRTKTLLGNGAAAYFSYDAANRLLSQKSILPGGTALTYFNYGYDAASRIVKIGREGGKTIYYSYDGADRLTGENWYNAGMQNVYAFAWSYDAVGNRRWQNRLGQQSYFTYDAANALRKSFPVGGSATYYSYDLNGNCTKIAAPASQTTYFAYNSVNLMARVTFRNGVSNYFSYDALNRRRALVDSNGPAYFMYDQDGLCQLVERSITGTVRAEYTRGSAPVPGIGDMVAAKINTATTTYYQYPVYDQPGNVHRIVNAAGAISGSFEYNAWGEKLLNQPPPEGTRFSFSAPAWVTLNDDPDERLFITRARTYYSGIGRFMQKDPEDGLAGGYIYALANPLSYTDPEGTFTLIELAVGVVVVAVAVIVIGYGVETSKEIAEEAFAKASAKSIVQWTVATELITNPQAACAGSIRTQLYLVGSNPTESAHFDKTKVVPTTIYYYRASKGQSIGYRFSLNGKSISGQIPDTSLSNCDCKRENNVTQDMNNPETRKQYRAWVNGH